MYAVHFEKILHAKKGGMKDNEIPVIITVPNPISRLSSPQANLELCPSSLYSSGTTPTKYDKRHSSPTCLGYLTGRLASAKYLNGTTYPRMGRLSTLHQVYEFREGALPRIDATSSWGEERKFVDLSSIDQEPWPRRWPRHLLIFYVSIHLLSSQPFWVN